MLVRKENKIIRKRKVESVEWDDKLDDICFWLSEMTGANITCKSDEKNKGWSFDIHLDGKNVLSIVIHYDSIGVDTTSYDVGYYANDDFIESKRFRINDDDPMDYVSELAIRHAEKNNYFEDSFIDEEEDDMMESHNRRIRRR